MNMSSLEQIRLKNPTIQIMTTADPAFRQYGKCWTGLELPGITALSREIIPIRPDGVAYVPGIPALEAIAAEEAVIRESVFGGMPIQIGYCSGQNLRMDGMEFHQGSELIVALSDAVLLLGTYGMLHEKDGSFTMDSGEVEAFFLESGEIVELYGGIMHYAPVQVDAKGFLTLIILLRNTNTALPAKVSNAPSDKLLMARNKWLITHPDAGYGYQGMTGKNITFAAV
jgi:hypothetical protein